MNPSVTPNADTKGKMKHRQIENQLSEMTWDALEKGKGRRFSSKFIEPGIIKYNDENGSPYVALVKKETIDRFINSIIGCPLIIKHQDVNKNTVEDLRCGIISDVKHNPQDGWFYCSGIVWDEEAIVNIEEKGWSVSCTYVITDEGAGGVYHDLPYEVEFLNGDFEHLALVENPRYEGATIVLNSKGEPIRRKQNAAGITFDKWLVDVEGISMSVYKTLSVEEQKKLKEKFEKSAENSSNTVMYKGVPCPFRWKGDGLEVFYHKEWVKVDESEVKSINESDNGGSTMFKKKSENEKVMDEAKKILNALKESVDSLVKKVGNEKSKLLDGLYKAINEASSAINESCMSSKEEEKEKKNAKDKEEKEENESEDESSKEDKEEKENESEAESSKDEDEKENAKDDEEKENESEAESESENESDEEDGDKKAKAKKKHAKNESSEDELLKSKKAANTATKEIVGQPSGFMTMEDRLKLGKELF